MLVVTFRCQLAHVTSFLFCTTPMSAISDASFYDEEITNYKQPSKQTITQRCHKQSSTAPSSQNASHTLRIVTHVKQRTVVVWNHVIFEDKGFWQGSVSTDNR